MKALTWQGKRDVRVETVPDPTIEDPTDAIIRVTSSGLGGSDLHLYSVLRPRRAGRDLGGLVGLGPAPRGVPRPLPGAGGRARPGADGRRRGRRLRGRQPG